MSTTSDPAADYTNFDALVEYGEPGSVRIYVGNLLARVAALEAEKAKLVKDIANIRTHWASWIDEDGRAPERVVELEAENQQLRQLLRRIADMDDGSECACDHSTADCCARVGVYCQHCMIAVALADPSPLEHP